MRPANPPKVVRSTAELAEILGLSRWTVSRALNGHKGVKAETLAAVRAAMAEHGFTPSALAQGLRKGRTAHVGVCVPNLEGFYLGPRLELLREALGARGFRLVLGMSNDDAAEEARVLRDFVALRVAGIATFASRLSDQAFLPLTRDGMPALRIDPLVGKAELGVDRTCGMQEATAHLLALGHERFAVVGLAMHVRYARARLAGVERALRAAGKDPARALTTFTLDETAQSEAERGRRVAREIVRAKAARTAVLALNDRVATGLLAGLRELGLRVPADVSVVGYDNMPLLDYVTPRLTTIDLGVEELMARATRSLVSRIEGTEAREPVARVRSRLVVKETTGPAPHPRRRARRKAGEP
jgi:DNA-binding LacI/PurR family transcriptional regulator